MLALDGVVRRFGGLVAVDGLDLVVESGARLGLIGPNGSGKTTVLNLLSGLVAPDAGRIALDGTRLDGSPARIFARRGIARTFQNLRLVAPMTVAENIAIAQHTLPGASLVRRGTTLERARRQAADAMLDSTGLGAVRDIPAGALPLPLQRRVELARALLRVPRILLLDEPAGGLTPAETDDMAALLRRLVPAETALVLVEHKFDLVAALCGRVCVLDRGRRIAEATPRAVFDDPAVAALYFGRRRAEGAGHA